MITSLLAALCSLTAFCFTPDDIATYTLENGLQLYVLPDATSAPVRIELVIYAGYSVQTERTAGYLPLYARLLSRVLSASVDGVSVAVGADCVRIVQTTAPLAVDATLSALSEALRAPFISDALLHTELEALQAEVVAYADSATGFINTAIDARMFPAAPWQQESGVYPALFTAASVASSRAVLESVAVSFYTAENAMLFISGNISAQAALSLTAAAFANVRTGGVLHTPRRSPASHRPPVASASSPATLRRYVLVDDAFSADMAQIVLQYTGFTRDQADVLAAALDDDRSQCKAALTAQSELGIRGAPYVHVASAQQCGSSRLLLQSLLEETALSPCEQAERFIATVQAADYLSQAELTRAAARFTASLERHKASSRELMELLASWFATSGAPFDAATLFNRAERLSALTASALLQSLREQAPTVFVLVNSAVYKRCAAAFTAAGYELVTAQNGSWYTQQLYLARLAETAPASAASASASDELSLASQRFVAENTRALTSFTLTNNIPVTVKEERDASTVSFLMTIRGGELLFLAKTPGLCALLTDALALSMHRAFDAAFTDGALSASCTVTSETFAAFSRICITCQRNDLAACVRLAALTLIYGDITPVMADGVAYDERTQWRLKTGTATFQLLCEAMRTCFGAPYSRLYNDKEDKPASLTFSQITAGYPQLLDATRYSFVLVGGVAATPELAALLEESFGVLVTRKGTADRTRLVKAPKLPRKTKNVKLRHLFLTDVSADKAGPRPAVLVPTTEFYDPLLYCIPSPPLAATDSAIFNALLYELSARLQKLCGDAFPVRLEVADDDIPFARLYVSRVTHTADIDAAYRTAVSSLKAALGELAAEEERRTESAPAASDDDAASGAPPAADALTPSLTPRERAALLIVLENGWLLQTLSETDDSAATARLIQLGLLRAQNAALYLEHYAAVSAATAQDYVRLMQTYLDETAPLRLYSADAKR